MKTPARALAVLLVALLLAGCQIILFPWPAGEPVPHVVGTWEGTWHVAPPLPMHVVFTTQERTIVSGFVTYEPPSGAVSMGITGEFGIRNGLSVLLMTVKGMDRIDTFELTTLEAARLEGMGSGSGLGGQQGPVSLVRSPRRPPG